MIFYSFKQTTYFCLHPQIPSYFRNSLQEIKSLNVTQRIYMITMKAVLKIFNGKVKRDENERKKENNLEGKKQTKLCNYKQNLIKL